MGDGINQFRFIGTEFGEVLRTGKICIVPVNVFFSPTFIRLISPVCTQVTLSFSFSSEEVEAQLAQIMCLELFD